MTSSRKKKKIKYVLNRLRILKRKSKTKAMYLRIAEEKHAEAVPSVKRMNKKPIL